MRNEIIIAFLIGIVIISGCIGQEEKLSDKDKAITACKNECNSRLNKEENLENGPCILDPITEVPDWICDVAHDPRQPIDNQPENQCSSYREGRAHHFVEVDTNCEVIKTF